MYCFCCGVNCCNGSQATRLQPAPDSSVPQYRILKRGTTLATHTEPQVPTSTAAVSAPVTLLQRPAAQQDPYLQQQQQQQQQYVQQQQQRHLSMQHYSAVQPRTDTLYSSAGSNCISSGMPYSDMVDDVTVRTQALNMLVDVSTLLQRSPMQQQQFTQPSEALQQQLLQQQQLPQSDVPAPPMATGTDLSLVITPYSGIVSESIGSGNGSGGLYSKVDMTHSVASSGASQNDDVVTDVAANVAATTNSTFTSDQELLVASTAQQQCADAVNSATEVTAESGSTVSTRLAHAEAVAGTAARAQELLDRLLAEQLEGHSSTLRSVTAAKDLLKERMCHYDRQHDVKAVCAAGHLLHELIRLRGSCHGDKDTRVLQMWAESQHKRAQAARIKLQKVPSY
jgi:hypothetical protein